MKATDPRENGHRYWDLAAIPQRLVAERTPAATAMARVMARATGLAAGETVLDLGCGPGAYFRFLRAAVGESGLVVGVDNSAGMLAKARARIAREGWDNVIVEAADATTAELGVERYDVVIAQYSFSAMPDIGAAVRQAHDALRPGGRLFVADVRLVPGGRTAPLVRLLRAIYRRLAGATGEDVLPYLVETFGSVTHVGRDGTPVENAVRPWPPLIMLVATK
jgi:ubiquinone/menaquinone biosynthesis C-methylase UbiE